MKGIIRIVIVFLIPFILLSCSFNTEGKSQKEAVLKNNYTKDGSPKVTTFPGIKMKTVLYTPSAYVGNASPPDPKEITSILQISLSIPSEWTGTSGNYKHYDRRTSSYATVLEIQTPVNVDDDFVPTKEMLHLFGFDKIFSRKLITSANMTSGKTAEGYEYSLFVASNRNTDLYLSIAFIRIDDRLILPLSFILPYDEKTISEICINSVKAHIKSSP